jgi:DNA-binding NtrC family response regulator
VERIDILIIDDEAVVRESLRQFIEKKGHYVDECSTADAAIEKLHHKEFDVIFLDIRMPGTNGLDFLKTLQTTNPDIEVIMITGHGTMDTAIQALRLGASDFLKKPLRMEEIVAALEKTQRLLDLRKTEKRLRGAINTLQSQEATQLDLEAILIGKSTASRNLRGIIRKAGQLACRSILITGETGTGKEVVAKALHLISCDTTAPFIPVNCPALPENLVESELFGHVKGAFTGANTERLGAFEMADGGTLFLDEVADLRHSTQSKLLRVLETRQVCKIGSQKQHKVNVNVIAATNCNLLNLVSEKQFRQDLYYRLNTFEINLLPLRQRTDDIIPLATYFIQQYFLDQHLDGTITLSENAKNKLLDYHYPGNARELRNIIERAIIFSSSSEISAEHIVFPSYKQAKFPQQSTQPISPSQTPSISSTKVLSGEAKIIYEVLEEVKWNRTLAAQRLNISYDALRWRINKYRLK